MTKLIPITRRCAHLTPSPSPEDAIAHSRLAKAIGLLALDINSDAVARFVPVWGRLCLQAIVGCARWQWVPVAVR
ncbi:MAG: hypothetical protein KME26_22195 [Oscillatoria princeps RMCB-10]|nr:hypothetical protein [Oscillatoria princeps RMCB-10]